MNLKPGSAPGAVSLFRTKKGHIPARTAKVCPKGDKCPNQGKGCNLSHKPSHFAAVQKKLSKKGKGKGRGRKKSKGRGKAGAVTDGAADDEGDDYIPYYEIELDEADEPLADDDE